MKNKENSSQKWLFDRHWYLKGSYEEKQSQWLELNNIVVGDKLRITRKASDHEDDWENVWNCYMGDNGIIVMFKRDEGYSGLKCVIYGRIGRRNDFNYPYFVLEKV